MVDEAERPRRRLAVVIHRPLKCPWCGSTNQVKVKTIPEERASVHQCRSCGQRFKSVVTPVK